MEDKEIIKTIEGLKRKLQEQQNSENLINLLIAIEENKSVDIEHLVADLTIDYKSGNFVVRPSKGRQSSTQKINEKQLEWLTSRTSVYIDPNGPQQNYTKQSNLQKRLEALSKKMNQHSKDELVFQFSHTIVELERLIQDTESMDAENKFLRVFFKEHLSKRKKAVANQTAGLERKYKNNNQCMQECLDEILNSGDKDQELSKKTYKRFCNLVIKKFPNPPFIQKFRQSKAEKLQSLEMQKADIEACERNEWAPSSLRHFFERKFKIKVVDLV